MTDTLKQTHAELLQIADENDDDMRKMHDKVLACVMESGDPVLLDFIKAAIMSSQYAYMASTTLRNKLIESCGRDAENTITQGMSRTDRFYCQLIEAYNKAIIQNNMTIFGAMPVLSRTVRLCREARDPEEMVRGALDIINDLLNDQPSPSS